MQRLKTVRKLRGWGKTVSIEDVRKILEQEKRESDYGAPIPGLKCRIAGCTQPIRQGMCTRSVDSPTLWTCYLHM
jgi:hypothetical protein